METKHTPGPWKTFYEGSGDYLIVDQNGSEIASLSRADAHFMHTGAGATINEANARLIAAAPDLLAALNLALATIERLKPPKPFDSTQGTRDVINAAIAKAEGKE